MSSFINEDFMLSNKTARKLFHEHAEKMPIIDYHCHLVPQQIAENIQFRDITQLWLVDGHYGDHYKWRAMRANGVSEDYITGGKHTSWETFEKWAETVPYTMRNPLYHWTHLELSRVFGIDKLLKPETAREIFDECNAKLATEEFRGQALIRYRKDEQQRLGTLARMGAVCVDFDLYGWGQSAEEVGEAAHHTSRAHVYQAACGYVLLDYMLTNRKDIDHQRVGVMGGSGGGTHTVLLSLLDNRVTASAPVVHLASHFDGGCPCESGMPVQ